MCVIVCLRGMFACAHTCTAVESEPAVAALAHDSHAADGTPNGSRSDAQAAAASAPAAVAAEQVVPSVRDDSDVDV